MNFNWNRIVGVGLIAGLCYGAYRTLYSTVTNNVSIGNVGFGNFNFHAFSVDFDIEIPIINNSDISIPFGFFRGKLYFQFPYDEIEKVKNADGSTTDKKVKKYRVYQFSDINTEGQGVMIDKGTTKSVVFQISVGYLDLITLVGLEYEKVDLSTFEFQDFISIKNQVIKVMNNGVIEGTARVGAFELPIKQNVIV